MQETAKHGLTGKCQADALGMLMDLTEIYMKEMVNKVVQKARLRMQDTQPSIVK